MLELIYEVSMFYSILSKFLILCAALMVLYTYKLPGFSVYGINISLQLYTFTILLLGISSTILLFKSKIKIIENEALKQKIKKEASEINSQEYKDKIDRLNAKIETLEVALKDALSKK